MAEATQLHQPRLVLHEEFRDLKSLFRPIDEGLYGRLQDLQAELESLEALYSRPDWGPDSEPALLTIRQCWENLASARECIIRRSKRRRFFLENFALFSHLVHRVDADLLLIVPLTRLATLAAEVLNDFERNISKSADRALWLGVDGAGRLPKALELIEAEARKAEEGTNVDHRVPSTVLPAERELFRHANILINRYSELSYQQLNFATLVRVLCSVALVVSGIGVLVAYVRGTDSTTYATTATALNVMVMLLGSTGAFLALILSKDARVKTRGPIRRHLAYLLFVRPTLGVAAAYLIYLAARFGTFSVGVEPNVSLISLHMPIVDASKNSPGTVAAYALVAIVSGFGAERVLGRLMEDVLDRLYRKADKKERNPAEDPPGRG